MCFFAVVKIWTTEEAPIGGCFYYAELIDRYGSVVFVRYLAEQDCSSALAEAQKLVEREQITAADDRQGRNGNMETIGTASYNKTAALATADETASMAATAASITTGDVVAPVDVASTKVATECHQSDRQTRSASVAANNTRMASKSAIITTDSRHHQLSNGSRHHYSKSSIKEGVNSSPFGAADGHKRAHEFDIVPIKYANVSRLLIIVRVTRSGCMFH